MNSDNPYVSEAWRYSRPADPTPRLSLQFTNRTVMATALSFASGFGLGSSHGSINAGYRFRAEHAHKLPESGTAWYFYHKSKNYHKAFGAVTEGLKLGTKMGLAVGGFFVVEEAVDRVRGRKDFLSSLVAGLGISGAFSLWNKFPLATAARTAKTGLMAGLGFGLAQDMISLLKGHKIGYIDFIVSNARVAGEKITGITRDDDIRLDENMETKQGD